MIYEIKTDFDNRKEITKLSLQEIMLGLFCRSQQYRRLLKIYRRGIEKVN